MDLYLIDHLYSQSDQPSKVVLSTIRQLVSYTEVQYERSKIIQSTKDYCNGNDGKDV